MYRYIFVFIIIAFCYACQPSELVQEGYTPEIPQHFFPLPVPDDNPLTIQGIALGKRLFFDPILSADSTMSCASCHLPEQAFADNLAQAVGINGHIGERNVPSLLNVAYIYTGLFWDGRVETLEEQALIPVEDKNEMGHRWSEVEKRLRSDDEYVALFMEAFPINQSDSIDKYWVAKALAQYQRTLISGEAKFDRVMRGEASFTTSEQRGHDIFFDASADLPNGECAHCHNPPLFTDQTYMNNGAQQDQGDLEFKDSGRGKITNQKYDNGRFRVPSLRNVALTAPYMHDGGLTTLEEVIDHYNNGGHSAINVDPKIRNLHLSDQEKSDLVNFLKTLTELEFVDTL
jgi:cytochrome c peroxidase